MMVRTYGRRSRGGIGRTLSDSSLNGDVSDDPFSFSEEEEESPQDVYNFTFSSQDSARWTFDSDSYSASPASSQSKPMQLLAPVGGSRGGALSRSKKVKNEKGETRFSRPPLAQAAAVKPLTATLMETQEFGEMMEYVDEVNFALDGLRRGQPVRIRRASLLSLLTICADSQHRRLLRAHGMAKTILDAVMGLSPDDSPSNLAASALFYALTADGHDNYLLDSSSSIGFLIKLLKPLASANAVDKTPTIGHKLLAFRKDAYTSQDVTKKLESSSDTIVHKVEEFLLSCKDIKSRDNVTNGNSRPELSPKWIALLTMEKACLSNVSLEGEILSLKNPCADGAVKRTGGNFKETLRELGGLDAVFELATQFHSILEGWMDHVSTPNAKFKDDESTQCPVLLLKCLKIMENATFLSKENQSHLLAMRQCLGGTKSSLSFTKLTMKFVKILSDLCLRTSSATPNDDMPINISADSEHSFEFPTAAENRADSSRATVMRSSQECSSSGRLFPSLGSDESQSRDRSCSRSESVEPAATHAEDNGMIKMRIKSSMSSSCSVTSKSSGCGALINGAHLKMKSNHGKRPYDLDESAFTNIEDSEDPFAFDEDEFKPSKWDILSRRSCSSVAQTKKSRASKVACRSPVGECSSQPIPKREEVKQIETRHSSQTSCSSVGEENANVLADCLLTAVKVLMNLTNDNEDGCRQIAACGGLETLSSLIASHYPSFCSSLRSSSPIKEFDSLSNSVIDLESQTDIQLSDHEIDLLVAILGLLVNLVEKDDRNRSRLAAACVSVPSSQGQSEESEKGVIPLFCSIFLANQGAGEAVGEGNESWDDEVALMQGEKEAEKMIIEAYSALLLAFLSTESQSTREAIASYLPKQRLSVLVPVLERFVAFHVTLDMISPETHKSVNEVIESLRIM